MKHQNRTIQPNCRSQLQAVPRRQFLRSLGAGVLGTSILSSFADGPSRHPEISGHATLKDTPAMGMKPGDIFYTDSEAAVLKVDLLAAQAQVVCAGGVLVRPFGIALLPNGDIVVSDTGSLALAVLDGRTGTQRTVPRGDGLGVPFGIAADRHGNVYVANAQVIRKVEKQKEAEAWPTKRHSHEPV